jgi:hypothetical protein
VDNPKKALFAKLEPTVIATSVAGILALVGYVASRGVGFGGALAAVVAALTFGAVCLFVARRLWTLDIGALTEWGTGTRVLVHLAGIAAVVLLVRLGGFVLDPVARPGWSTLPHSAFITHHNCVTTHFEAGRMAAEGQPNVYLSELYRGTGKTPRLIGPFHVPDYQYPPPFLLLPRLAVAFSRDFPSVQRVWFALDVFIAFCGLLGLARWIGGRDGMRVALLAPLLFCAVPTLMTLQCGHFQLVTIVTSVLAMVAFDRERPALGGAMLSFVTLSKFFPGILILYLLLRKRWWAVAWTAGFAVFFIVLGWLVLGRAPYDAFLSYQLPRLSSGEASRRVLSFPWSVAQNQSVFGIPLKLELLHVPFMTGAFSKTLAWVYTLIVGAVCYVASKRGTSRLSLATIWVALLGLGTMRTPFLAQEYGPLPALLLVALLAAGTRKVLPVVPALAACWLCLNIYVHREFSEAHSIALSLFLTALPQGALLAIYGFALWRADRPPQSVDRTREYAEQPFHSQPPPTPAC